MSKAYFAIFLLALIVVNAIGKEPSVIFEKAFEDGSIVTVEMRVREERIAGQEDEAIIQMEGRAVRYFGGDVKICDVTMKKRDKQGKEEIVWENELRALIMPGSHVPTDVKVLDVEKRGNKLAIVYIFDNSTNLEIARKDDQGVYQIIMRQLLYRGAEFKTVSDAKLVWFENLFALVAFGHLNPEIWRVDSKHQVVERIYPTLPAE